MNKKIILPLAATILLAGCLSIWHIKNSSTQNGAASKENVIDYSPPTDQQKDAGSKAKETFLNSGSKSDESTQDSTETAQPENDTPITITSISNQNDKVSVRSMISRVDDSGTCTISLKKAGETDINREASTQVLGSYSVCKGFDIPVSDLSPGSWSITIIYKSQDGTHSGSASSSVKV